MINPSFFLENYAVRQPALNLAGRILVANEAWQELLAMLELYRQTDATPSDRKMLLPLFTRFIHELIGDPDLRKQLVEHFDQLMASDALYGHRPN
jgi:hypothetical protein